MPSIKNIVRIIPILFLVSRVSAQVTLQTGSAVFSLPMFKWQDNHSKLNSFIALDYNSGNGLNVNAVASNEGQGWALVAGGVITRIREGNPDDQKPYHEGTTEQVNDLTKYPAGYLYDSISPYLGCPKALTKYPLFRARNKLYKQRNLVGEDRELDYFNFRFGGKSGRFILDPTHPGKCIPLGDTKIKISYKTNTTLATGDTTGIRTTITSFTVQGINGLKYTFATLGEARVLAHHFAHKNGKGIIHQPTFKDGHVYYQSSFITSKNSKVINPWIIDNWYLSKIEDPLTGRTIHFYYTTLSLDNPAGIQITFNKSHIKHKTHKDKNYIIVSYQRSVSRTPRIDSIIYPDGHRAIFNYSNAQRVDFNGEHALKSVAIKYNGKYLSEYRLNTTYFILNRYGFPRTSYQKRVARLCLKSVRKLGPDLKDEAPPYRFHYYIGGANSDEFVPPPFFYAHDIWGYYNGNASKGYIGNSIPLNEPISALNYRQLRGLCFLRENTSAEPVLNPKSGYAKFGLLKEVVYPTGGTLTYHYSQNEGTYPGESADTPVGGVHVSETTTTDGGYQHGCDNPLVTHYTYVLNSNGASSLWGLEKPVNLRVVHAHYAEDGKYHKFPLLWECHWHFRYPGILSEYQTTSIGWFQSLMQSAAPIFGVIGIVGDILDVQSLIAAITASSSLLGPIAWVTVDVIALLVGLFISCSPHSQYITNTTYYNLNLNAMCPLPEQFKRVVAVQGSGGDGKTIQTFTSDEDYPIWVPAGDDSLFTPKQRFAPWAYGLPKLTEVFDANGHLIKETENVYNMNDAKTCISPSSAPSQPTYSSVHPNVSIPEVCHDSAFLSCNCQVLQTTSQRITNWANASIYGDTTQYYNDFNPPPANTLKYDIYHLYKGRVELATTYQRIYNVVSPEQYLQTETDYSYNDIDNYKVNQIATHKSNGDIIYKNIKYSSDYPTGILDSLVKNNIIALPVETLTSELKAGQSSRKYLDEKVTEYTRLANGNIKPSHILVQRFSKPQSGIGLYGGPGSDISRYKIKKAFAYDAAGNLTGMWDEGFHNITNIYGYHDKFVIATVINANPLITPSAYSSFETNGEWGGWVLQGTADYVTTQAVTGKYSLNLSSGTSLTSPLNKNQPYTLSFWATGSGVSVSDGATLIESGPTYKGFTYYQYQIPAGNTSISVTGSTIIDELRLYPQNARMRTTTFNPLIGKTSVCDENNRIVYYSYDDMGRLQLVKNAKGKVMKMMEYNNVSVFKQGGCPVTYYNHEISEVFTRNNCSQGTVPDTTLYTYVVPADKYTSTISQVDADAKAQTELLTYGQAEANANSACIALYYNDPISITDTTEGCPVGSVGGPVTYTVPANTYSSVISQADADSIAMRDAKGNSWTYINSTAHRSCIVNTSPNWIWNEGDPTKCEVVNDSSHQFDLFTDINPNSPTYNQTQWKDTRQQGSCASCIPSFTYSSVITTSIFNDISIQNDTIVNFTWVFDYPSGGSSGFTLGTITTSCCLPHSTRTVPFIQDGATYNMTIYPSGQVLIELVSGSVPPAGTTVGFSGSYDINRNAYYSDQESGYFTRNNCPSGETGSTVLYTISPYRYKSYISQQDANQKAIDAVNAYGQTYANENGTCSVNCGFTPASGLNFYTKTVSESGNTVNFYFVFPNPGSNYVGGTIGTITGGCVPSSSRGVEVTGYDGNKWYVQIYSSGVVHISLESGTPPVGPPIQLQGSYNL